MKMNYLELRTRVWKVMRESGAGGMTIRDCAYKSYAGPYLQLEAYAVRDILAEYGRMGALRWCGSTDRWTWQLGPDPEHAEPPTMQALGEAVRVLFKPKAEEPQQPTHRGVTLKRVRASLGVSAAAEAEEDEAPKRTGRPRKQRAAAESTDDSNRRYRKSPEEMRHELKLARQNLANSRAAVERLKEQVAAARGEAQDLLAANTRLSLKVRELEGRKGARKP